MSNIQQQFGKRIRTLRTQRNWSQEQFADNVKLHRTYIGALERGEKNVTIKNIERIAQCLDVSVPELFIFPPMT